MGEMQIDYEQTIPYRSDDRKGLNEPEIAKYLIKKAGMYSKHGKSYDLDGELTDDDLQSAVSHFLSETMGVQKKVSSQTKDIISLARMLSIVDDIPVAKDEIPLKNGTLTVHADGSYTFSSEKHQSPFRLNCRYDPGAKTPENWFKWGEIMTPEDWYCFQEIMGYLMLPTTAGQKMFFLLGAGGEGKSIWGYALQQMCGNGFTSVKIHDLESNRFTIALLENKVVGFDDDMSCDKLKDTNNIKKIITSIIYQLGERKSVDQFQFMPFVTLCGCGNFALTSLYDTSDGFFRRLLPIKVKNKSPDRKDIPSFEKLLDPEIDGIFMWALEGLQRLIRNNYRFSISERSQELLDVIKEDSNSVFPFAEEMILYDPKYRITTNDLTVAYNDYCAKNKIKTRGSKAVVEYFRNHEDTLGVKYTKHACGDKRGFIGMSVKGKFLDLDALLGGKGGEDHE